VFANFASQEGGAPGGPASWGILQRFDLRPRGRRSSKRGREQISAPVEALVSKELWEAAQAALARNRLIIKNTTRSYLLKSVLHCSLDGMTYVGSQGRGDTWYRCGGQLVERGPLLGRCPGQSVKGEAIEPAVWADIERFLRDPGDLLAELDVDAERQVAGDTSAAQLTTLAAALVGLEAQRQRAVALAVRGAASDSDLDVELARIANERAETERRQALLIPPPELETPTLSPDLLEELRAKLDAGLSAEQQQEIVRLLVAKIVIHTELLPDGTKRVRAAVHYRLPAVGPTCTGSGSLRPQTRSTHTPAAPREPRGRPRQGPESTLRFRPVARSLGAVSRHAGAVKERRSTRSRHSLFEARHGRTPV
jgi:hypothetical protein